MKIGGSEGILEDLEEKMYFCRKQHLIMSMLRITQLEMHQIGPFGDLALEFPPKPDGMEDKAEIHILTGENGTGKSTVLEAAILGLAQSYVNDIYDHKWRNNVQNELKLSFNNEDSNVIRRVNNTYQNIAKSPTLNSKFRAPFDNLNLPFSVAFFAYSGNRHVNKVNINGIKDIPTHPLVNALHFQRSIDSELLLQWIANNIAAEAIAKNQGDSIEAEKIRNTISQLERTISNIIQKEVKFRLEYKPYSVSIKVEGELLDFNQLPDGLKSIISWLADILMRMDRVKWENDTPVFERNFILFLDEIEVHLHPAWQRKILPVVQRLFPNAQIFISTHSPFVVGSVDGAWIHKLVKPNGDSKLAEGYPKLSEDGNSFRYWLDEVFDVSDEFGIDVERQLKEFYALRDKVLKSDNESLHEELINKGRELAEQSAELNQIIQMELRQVNRRKSLSLSI